MHNTFLSIIKKLVSRPVSKVNYDSLSESEQLICKLAFFLINQDDILWDESVNVLHSYATYSDLSILDGDSDSDFFDWCDIINCQSFKDEEFAAEKLTTIKMYQELGMDAYGNLIEETNDYE